jgi:hypothetical protein
VFFYQHGKVIGDFASVGIAELVDDHDTNEKQRHTGNQHNRRNQIFGIRRYVMEWVFQKWHPGSPVKGWQSKPPPSSEGVQGRLQQPMCQN